MSSSGTIRAGRAYVEVGTDNAKLNAGLAAAHRQLKTFGNAVGMIGTSMMGVGAAILAPLAATTKLFASMGDGLGDMSKRTGISVESLSQLRYAAEQSGTSLEQVEVSVKRMQKSIAGVADEAEGTTGKLDALGLVAKDLAGLGVEGQFKLIADRVSQISDPTERAAAALTVFGRSGTALLPMMQSGARGIDELQAAAQRLGLTISTESAKQADEFSDTIGDLLAVSKAATFQLGSALAPTLKAVATDVLAAAQAASTWIASNREMVLTVAQVGAGALAIGAALKAVGVASSLAATGLTAMGTVMLALNVAMGRSTSGVSLRGTALTQLDAVTKAATASTATNVVAYLAETRAAAENTAALIANAAARRTQSSASSMETLLITGGKWKGGQQGDKKTEEALLATVALDRLVGAQGRNATAIKQLAPKQRLLARLFSGVGTAANGARGIITALGVTVGGAAMIFSVAGVAAAVYVGAMRNANKELDEAREKLRKAEEASAGLDAAFAKVREARGDLSRATGLDAQAAALKKLTEAYKELAAAAENAGNEDAATRYGSKAADLGAEADQMSARAQKKRERNTARDEGITKLDASLKEQIDTFGMAADEIEVYKLQQLGAKESMLDSVRGSQLVLKMLKDEKDAREKAAKAIEMYQDRLDQLDAEHAQIGGNPVDINNQRMKGLTNQGMSDEQAKAIIKRENEVAAAKARADKAQQAGEANATNRADIAELELRAKYKGVELERQLLELEHQKEVAQARRIGASVDLIDKEYALRRKIIDAGEQVKDSVKGTFNANAVLSLQKDTSSPNEKRIAVATEANAKDTAKLVNLVRNGAMNTRFT